MFFFCRWPVSGGTAFGYRIRYVVAPHFVFFPHGTSSFCVLSSFARSRSSWCLCTAHAATRTRDQSVVGLASNIKKREGKGKKVVPQEAEVRCDHHGALRIATTPEHQVPGSLRHSRRQLPTGRVAALASTSADRRPPGGCLGLPSGGSIKTR